MTSTQQISAQVFGGIETSSTCCLLLMKCLGATRGAALPVGLHLAGLGFEHWARPNLPVKSRAAKEV